MISLIIARNLTHGSRHEATQKMKKEKNNKGWFGVMYRKEIAKKLHDKDGRDINIRMHIGHWKYAKWKSQDLTSENILYFYFLKKLMQPNARKQVINKTNYN